MMEKKLGFLYRSFIKWPAVALDSSQVNTYNFTPVPFLYS